MSLRFDLKDPATAAPVIHLKLRSELGFFVFVFGNMKAEYLTLSAQTQRCSPPQCTFESVHPLSLPDMWKFNVAHSQEFEISPGSLIMLASCITSMRWATKSPAGHWSSFHSPAHALSMSFFQD